MTFLSYISKLGINRPIIHHLNLKAMKKCTYLSATVMTFIIVSCNSNQINEANEHCPTSYELIDGDTVNVISCRGKQGKWVPSTSNKLQDTTYYKNDTIIEKQ